MTRVTVKNHLDSTLDEAVDRQVNLSIRAIEDTLRSLLITLDHGRQNSLRILCSVSADLSNGSHLAFEVENSNAETALRDALERVRREARRSRALRSTG